MIDTNNPFSEDQQIEVIQDYYASKYPDNYVNAGYAAYDLWKYLDDHQLEIRYK